MLVGVIPLPQPEEVENNLPNGRDNHRISEIQKPLLACLVNPVVNGRYLESNVKQGSHGCTQRALHSLPPARLQKLSQLLAPSPGIHSFSD